MTAVRRACIALALLSLLAGCQPEASVPSGIPVPVPSATPEVTVHWDMLEEPAAPPHPPLV